MQRYFLLRFFWERVMKSNKPQKRETKTQNRRHQKNFSISRFLLKAMEVVGGILIKPEKFRKFNKNHPIFACRGRLRPQPPPPETPSPRIWRGAKLPTFRGQKDGEI